MGPLSLKAIAEQVGVSEAIVESVMREFSAIGSGAAFFTMYSAECWKLGELGYEKLLEA